MQVPLVYIFFEDGPMPPAHLLNLRIQEACQGERICPTTPQGVCINSVDGDSFCRWVVKNGGGSFESHADILVCDVQPLL